MKNIIYASLVVVFSITACEEIAQEPIVNSTEEKDLKSFTITDEEIDEMLLKEKGTVMISYEERMKFIAEYTSADILKNISKDSESSARQNSLANIVCAAGIHDGSKWVYNYDYGKSNEYVRTAKGIYFNTTSQYTGASSYITWNSSVYAMHFGGSLDTYSCSGVHVKSYASAKFNNGVTDLTAYVGCDD